MEGDACLNREDNNNNNSNNCNCNKNKAQWGKLATEAEKLIATTKYKIDEAKK